MSNVTPIDVSPLIGSKHHGLHRHNERSRLGGEHACNVVRYCALSMRSPQFEVDGDMHGDDALRS